MSVSKYRNVDEMPPPPRVTGQDLANRIRAVWARARHLAGPAYVTGVQKFASVEDAQLAREQAIQERVRRLKAQRGTPGL
ncbi:MAG: hypothetical protein MJE77_03975 [Proteobacteria bacterium]|nr:hypothetical protein [Pseudomonadota bacterium]